MPKAYTRISDLTKQIKECKIIDLIPHVSGINPVLLEALEPSNHGLYLPGSIEPLFTYQTYYYLTPKTHFNTDLLFKVNVDKILKDINAQSIEDRLPPGHFFDAETNEVFMKRATYERLKRHLKTIPQISVRGCEAAIATVLSYLNTLCPDHTHVPVRHYELSSLVKPEYQYLLDDNTFEVAFDDLFLEVASFVGNDNWNVYHYKVVGTTLIIEKGLDFRIIDWHSNQIKQSEHYDHDFGGIPERYEEQNTSH